MARRALIGWKQALRTVPWYNVNSIDFIRHSTSSYIHALCHRGIASSPRTHYSRCSSRSARTTSSNVVLVEILTSQPLIISSMDILDEAIWARIWHIVLLWLSAVYENYEMRCSLVTPSLSPCPCRSTQQQHSSHLWRVSALCCSAPLGATALATRSWRRVVNMKVEIMCWVW